MQYLFSIIQAQAHVHPSSSHRSKYYVLICLFIFTLYHLSRIYLNVVYMSGLVLQLFWVPQIIRNAQRNTRQGLDYWYLGITTLAKLFIPLYVWGCPHNIVTIYYPSSFFLCGIVCASLSTVLLLLLQDKWGSRFFIPSRVS